jgi:hypothetical protein
MEMDEVACYYLVYFRCESVALREIKELDNAKRMRFWQTRSTRAKESLVGLCIVKVDGVTIPMRKAERASAVSWQTATLPKTGAHCHIERRRCCLQSYLL